MRRVIERKKVWRAALESFEAVAYSRYTVSNDTGIVFILESVSDAYWDRERGMREENHRHQEDSRRGYGG